jgi:hypothetical protein
VKEADKLGFGLVEFDHRLFGPNMGGDLDLGSLTGIFRTLNLIISFRHHKSIDAVLRNISSAMNSGKAFVPGLNDMVPLCSATLSQSDNKYSGPDPLVESYSLSKSLFERSYLLSRRIPSISPTTSESCIFQRHQLGKAISVHSILRKDTFYQSWVTMGNREILVAVELRI